MEEQGLRKSVGDLKDYRIVTLEGSRLECLLVSSENTSEGKENVKAAAAMSVQVGSFADPAVAEGCAHFLEHMVFMGSSKYPGENHYDSFVTSHGGSCNAFTEGEYTAYQFDVNAEHFREALDIFASCFISPLLSVNAAEREISAIDSEFNLAKIDDGSRLQQLYCHQAQDGHILRKFSWGNLDSLKRTPAQNNVDVHTILRAFHSKHYVPQNMKLVVVAPQSLDDLEKYVRECFCEWHNPFATDADATSSALKKQRTHSDSGVAGSVSKVDLASLALEASSESLPDSETSSKRVFNLTTEPLKTLEECLEPVRGTEVISKTALATLTRVHPLKHTNKLMLVWQLPAFCKLYRTKPCAYIGHLLGHEGSGSVLSLLKEKNFATSLSAGVSESNFDDNSMITLLEVSVALTDFGLANWTAVAHCVHQYLHMLRDVGPQKRIFDELQQTCNLYFRYIDEEEPSDYAERLSVEMLPYFDRYPRSDVIAAPHLLWDWSPDLIAQILAEQLTPRRAKVTLVSTAFTAQQTGEGQKEDGHDSAVAKENDESAGSDDGSGSDVSSNEGADEDSVSGSESGSEDGSEEEEDEEEESNEPAVAHLSAEKIASLYEGPAEWLPLVLPPSQERVCLVEPHFGTQYWEDGIPESLYTLWEGKNESFAALHLPPPNPFIPSDLSLITVEANAESKDVAPERLLVTVENSVSTALLWHLPDVTFASPKVEINIRLASIVPLQDAHSSLMLDILCRMLRERVNEELYMASMADLDCNISTADSGLVLKVSGFSDKASLLASSVASAAMAVGSVTSWTPTEQRCFERVKEQLLRYYQNANMKASHAASNGRLRVLKPSKYSAAEKAVALEALVDSTAGSTGETHLAAFREKFWQSVSLECLVHGNVTKIAAVSMVQDILSHHANEKWSLAQDVSQPAFRVFSPPQPITQIPPHSALVLRQVPDNVQENNSCVEVYFQLGAWNLVDVTLLDLLEQVISEPFFDDLRTKQQLGYSVSCGVRQTYGTLGFCFQVQSSKFPVHEITHSILGFVSDIPSKIVAELAAERYQEQVSALRGNKLTPPPSLSEAARAHWSEIEDAHYCFFSAKQQATLLEDVTLCGQSALQAFSHKLFLGAPKVLVVLATRDSNVQQETFAALKADKKVSVLSDTNNACSIHAVIPTTV